MTHPQQPSVEELKECREAFEQWMQDTYGYVPEPNTVYREGTYLSKRDDDRWIAYQAGQNRRTEPSPAEVSSEGIRESDKQLLKFYDVSTLHELIDAQEKHILKLQETARRYLPQQSFVTNGGRNG